MAFKPSVATLLYKHTVEYQVQRMFEGGRVLEKHLRLASRVVGRITVTQEHDEIRRRTVLVARCLAAGPRPGIPPLFDVNLVGSTGDGWTLAGLERIESGPLRTLHFVGQAWLIEPVAVQELIDAERKWGVASGRVHQLEQQLISLGHIPVTPSN